MAEEPSSSPTDDLLPRLAEVVDSAIGVGAALVRTVAQATTSKDLPPVGEAHLQDMASFGATAVGNLLGMIVDGARAGTKAAPVPGRRTPPTTADTPQVTAGSTLRVPLLVENTGPAPTSEISFAVSSVERLDGDAVTGIGAVAFSPPTLVIAARDFEKLTVRIPTSPETDPGDYRVTVEGGDGWFSTTIHLAVISG